MMLMNILPKEGDFVTLKLLRKFRESLSFTEAEIVAIDFMHEYKCPKCDTKAFSKTLPLCPVCKTFMNDNKQVTWDEAKAASINKDVHIGDSMMALVQGTLQKMNAQKKLTELHMSLYEKFVESVKEGE